MVLTVLDSLHFQINLKISLSIYIFFKKWDFWWDSGIVLSLQINLGIMSILTISVFCAKNMVCVCAKSLQSCPTLCDPMDCSPPGSSVHGNSPGKTTGVRCCSLLQEIFPTQGSNPRLLHLPSLAGRFFTTSRDLPKPEQLKPIALDLGRAEVGTYHKVLKQLPRSRQLLCTSSFNPHHNPLRWVPVFSLYRGKEWDLEMIHNGANITVNKKLELAFMFY